jgi:hypothetical protein
MQQCSFEVCNLCPEIMPISTILVKDRCRLREKCGKIMIHLSCLEEWPEGQAHSAVYRPIDTISRVELRQQLNKVKMKKESIPNQLFKQYKTNIQDPEEELKRGAHGSGT